MWCLERNYTRNRTSNSQVVAMHGTNILDWTCFYGKDGNKILESKGSDRSFFGHNCSKVGNITFQNWEFINFFRLEKHPLCIKSGRIALVIGIFRQGSGECIHSGRQASQQTVRKDFCVCLAERWPDMEVLGNPLAQYYWAIKRKSLFHEPTQTASEKSTCDTKNPLCTLAITTESQVTLVNGVVMSSSDHFQKVWNEDTVVKKCLSCRSVVKHGHLASQYKINNS